MAVRWLVALAGVASAAPEADRVTSLPGFPGPLPTEWFSGYLSFGKKHLHYVLVESESKDPNAPLLLWMNGGPGCSSMDGLFYEHGPLLVDRFGTSLLQNPWSWNKLATVLYLEAPVGVGYSYSEDKDDKLHLNDTQTAQDNLQALKVFFSLYPEYKTRPFYVSGESYGGVYVPTLSLQVFMDSTVDWNMQGFIVGNGVFDWKLMRQSGIAFLHGHGAVSWREKAAIDAACGADYSAPSQECERLLTQAEQKADGLNVYDFYRTCFHEGAAAAGRLTAGRIAQEPDLLREVVRAPRPPHPALGEDVPCIDSVGGTVWLSRPEVRAALHVEPSLANWTICAGDIGYTRDMSYSAPKIYAQMKDKYRILVYNGDTDMACDFVADSWAMDRINATVDPSVDWVPWTIKTLDGAQTAGFITKYQTGPGMYFMTVKGAGHMVPQWKPQSAFEMLDRFLNNKQMSDGASVFVI